MPATDVLELRALALDAAGLAEALDALGAAERAETRAWILGADAESFFARVRDKEPQPLRLGDPTRELYGAAPWMRVMCLIASCPPAEAARAVPWEDIWDHMTPAARDHAMRMLADQPRVWAEKFLTTTADLHLSQRAAHNGGQALARLVAQGVAVHDLPCPEGLTFLERYLRYERHDAEAAARLTGDRLVPDLIYLMVEAGLAGQIRALHEAVPALVADGVVTRDRLIAACLESLTRETRVGSQRSVAKILDALHLGLDEVPGDLAFLIGVIATHDGAVGVTLLPLALSAVRDAAGLEELTRVVAGRKERKQKRMLLDWLKSPDARACVSPSDLTGVLDLLGSGQDDASLVRAVDAAKDELGAPRRPGPDRDEAVGLWDLTLQPGPPPRRPHWVQDGQLELDYFLDRRNDLYQPALETTVDRFVRGLAAGNDPQELVDLCHRLRVDGHLAVARIVTLLEAAFLAGGLSVTWSSAVQIADDVARAGKVLPGTHDLLRLLTRYAAEVRGSQPLPPHLSDLARGRGSTKAHLEARALAAVLPDPDPGAAPPKAAPPPTRGLWDLRPPVPAVPWLLDRYYPHYLPLSDEQLPYLLALGNGVTERFTVAGGGQCAQLDVQLVRTLALEVQASSSPSAEGEARRRVAAARRLPRSDEGPTCDAIRLWQRGELSLMTYRQVLAAHRLVGRPAMDHLVFSWTCEQLVRLSTHPGLLSSPDMTDGRVTLERLVARMRSFAGVATVGPVDLLLTLTRLRLDETAATDLDALADVPLWTDASLAVSSGGSPAYVGAVVRHWVEAGGEVTDGPTRDLLDAVELTAKDLQGPASHPDVMRRVWPRRMPVADERVMEYRDPRPLERDEGHLVADDWRALLREVFAENPVSRERTLTHVAHLAVHDDVLDPGVTVPTAMSALDAGELNLNRLADSLQWLFERGAMRALWPVGLAVAARAAGAGHKSAGLAFLLSALTSYVHEVPASHRAVPAELEALAGSSSSTKSRAAARGLVDALDGGTAT